MDIPEKLLNYKYHLIFVILLSFPLVFLLCYSTSAFTILSYFWPLFLSTALFLAAVVVFGQISPPESDASCEKTAEIIDYVAGQPDAKAHVDAKAHEDDDHLDAKIAKAHEDDDHLDAKIAKAHEDDDHLDAKIAKAHEDDNHLDAKIQVTHHHQTELQ